LNTGVDLVVRAGAALAAVYAFYLAAGTKWPTSYYLLDDVIASQATRTAGSFALFRFAPLFIASVCAMAYLPSLTDRMILAAIICFGHLMISLFRINPYTNPGPRRGGSWWWWQAGILVISLVLVIAAVWLAPVLGQALPQWKDIIAALVTALLVVSGSVLLQRSTSADRGVDNAAVDRSRAKYEQLVARIAPMHKVDRTFALALVISEDLQRPNWFRVLERRAARVGIARTVGVAQSVSDWFITDEEGIDRLLGSIGDVTANRQISRSKMAAAAERCNEGDGYVEFVLHVYDHLKVKACESLAVDVDGNPLITACRPRLMHGKWILSGDVGPSVDVLSAQDDSTQRLVPFELQPLDEAGRRRWAATLPIEWAQFTIVPNELPSTDYESCLRMYVSL
jgi:hypothetical protein